MAGWLTVGDILMTAVVGECYVTLWLCDCGCETSTRFVCQFTSFDFSFGFLY